METTDDKPSDATPEAGANGALTHARVVRIAAPIVLSNATVPLLGLVDTGVVGQIGEAAPIGAVALGATVLTAIYWIFGFLRMGTAGMTAQARGAGDGGEVAANLSRALLVGVSAGLILILIQPLVIAGALSAAPASAEVEAMTRDYLAIRIWSAPAAIAVFGVTGWLIGQERTGAVLWVQVGMNGINVVLDLIFVLGLGWGVGGVAVATVIAEWSGLAIGLWFCRDALRAHDFRNRARVFDRIRLKRMASVNGDILIRTALLEATFVSFTFLGADFGDVTLAANQVLLQFLLLAAFALDGFAFAAEALVGQAMGARARAALRRAAYLCAIWGAAVGAAMALIFLLAGPLVIDILTTAEDVRAAAREFLPWAIVLPLIGAAAWMLDGVFIGATRTADMRNMMAVSAAGYALAAVMLLPAYGNHGLWAALAFSFVLRGVTLGLRYPALERAAEA